MSRILIAEDEPRIASFLERGLVAHGYATAVVRTGDEALAAGRSGDFDLLILDLGLPGRDGMSVLATLRDEGITLPVVILTARSSVAAVVNGLEGGADDYITKPFRFDELVARVRVRLRDDRTEEPSVIHAADLALDVRRRRALVDGRYVELSPREFALAEMFFRHVGQVLSRRQLLVNVWGDDDDVASNVLDVYVGYLRKKLGRNRISSVRGLGYRLEPAPPARRRRG